MNDAWLVVVIVGPLIVAAFGLKISISIGDINIGNSTKEKKDDN
ncbi:hypothetical protein [Microbulbifer discodermiae]